MEPARALLVRSRLLERLAARWFDPVVAVVAPAGYGKTTLLSQAVAANALSPVGFDRWLTCTAELAVASSLGQRLCEVVDASVPGDGDVPTAVRDAVWRRSPQAFALILDDVHEIPADSEAARLLAAVVAALPANGHVVLAGRHLPPLDVGRAPLVTTDLVFTPEELAEFAALRGVPASTVAPCEGWPALAELYAGGGPAPGDYVDRVVLRRWPPERLEQLALLAGLGRFDDEIARAVLGPGVEVADVVESVPLVTRPAEGQWAVHPLWRDWLAGIVPHAGVADVRRRAGRVLLGRGHADQAVRLFADAGAWDDVTDAVATALRSSQLVEKDLLADWYGRLPGEARATPGGRLLAAALAGEDEPAAAIERFDDCAAAFRAAGHGPGEVACLAQIARLAWWLERPERMLGVGERVFELEAAGCAEATPLASLWRSFFAHFGGDDAEALAELDRADAGIQDGLADWLRSVMLLRQGRFAEAQLDAERAARGLGGAHALFADRTRAQALWLQGRGAEATEALAHLVERLARSGHGTHLALVTADASTAHAMQGHAEQAGRYLAAARSLARTIPPSPMLDTDLAIAEAATAVASGDEAGAAASLASYVERRPVAQGLASLAQTPHLACSTCWSRPPGRRGTGSTCRRSSAPGASSPAPSPRSATPAGCRTTRRRWATSTWCRPTCPPGGSASSAWPRSPPGARTAGPCSSGRGRARTRSSPRSASGPSHRPGRRPGPRCAGSPARPPRRSSSASSAPSSCGRAASRSGPPSGGGPGCGRCWPTWPCTGPSAATGCATTCGHGSTPTPSPATCG